MKRSRIVGLNRLLRFFFDAGDVLNHDRITVYAAQASFFTIISSIPFLMLLISLAKYVLPISEADIVQALTQVVPEHFHDVIDHVANELFGRSSFPLLSVSAVAMLWSASRGVAAVSRGIKNVYGTQSDRFIMDIIQSLLYTITFIAIIVITLIVLVFGGNIVLLLREHMPSLSPAFEWIYRIRGILFFVVLTLFFTFVYGRFSRPVPEEKENGWRLAIKNSGPSAIASSLDDHAPHHSARYTRLLTKCAERKYRLFGAAVASAGWMLFSFFYALYIRYFPGSYIYGGLAAVVLLMLWLYFCMAIMLFGAEAGKFLAALDRDDRMPIGESS